MMVVSNTLLRKQSTSQKGQSLPLLWWLVAQTAVSLRFSSPALVPCLLDFLPKHLPHQVKRERHYKVYTRTSGSEALCTFYLKHFIGPGQNNIDPLSYEKIASTYNLQLTSASLQTKERTSKTPPVIYRIA